LSQSLSVIIPSYNRAYVLTRALESVFSQADSGDIELEVIVIDDGSTDQTKNRVQEQFPQVNYHFQDNQGVSAARNLGLKHAKHEWVALLDSDDEWLPNKLELQFKLLKDSGLLVCHTDEIWIRNGVRVNQMKKHQKVGGWIFEHCLPLCAMSPSSIIFHKSVIENVGIFDQDLPACEDYDLWLRITSQYEVAFLETPMIKKYGGHDDQLSRQYWGMDRFRVIALEKILVQSLSEHYAELARNMLKTKLQILLLGARKRDNLSLIEECESELRRWE